MILDTLVPRLRRRAPAALLLPALALVLAAPGGLPAQTAAGVPQTPAAADTQQVAQAGGAVEAIPGTTARRGPTDAGEVEAFLDGVMNAQMAEKNIAGATVSVVRDGRLLFAKGYGYADVAERTPVDAGTTLFRIGSISKLFTWTAVMQLVEQGRLDLDADVNEYLDFEIPATYDEPITMRHVLAHTPGFEEDSRDLFSDDPEDLQDMGEWLATHIPGRVRPPGTFSSYSNYATALAGYIVQRISGEDYHDYLDRHILEPLGMRYATSRQPLPDELAPHMSNGYAVRNGAHEEEPFEIIIGGAPAGSMSASATDMARFMIAHLNHGELDGARILQEETARRMHARAFGHDDRLPGFALGFYEKSTPAVRIIGHGGDTAWFHSDMALFPSEDLGVFVSYNTQSGGELSFGPFLQAFLKHYYPLPPTPLPAPEWAEEQAAKVAGTYAFNRRSYTTFQKAFGLAGAIRVQADSAGAILVQSPLGPMRLLPVEPMLYREERGQGLVAFREEADGSVDYGFLGMAPMMALERLAWYESPRLHQVLLGLATLTFLLTVGAAVRRWWRRRNGITLPGDELPGRAWLVGLALANLAFLVALVAVMSDFEAVMSGELGTFKAALVLPILGLLLALVAAWSAVRQWRERAGTAGARIRYGAVVVLALLFVWSLASYNLLGWRM